MKAAAPKWPLSVNTGRPRVRTGITKSDAQKID